MISSPPSPSWRSAPSSSVPARLRLDQFRSRATRWSKDRGHPAADAVRPVRLPGCRPTRKRSPAGEADINLCPPGGMEGVQRLADLLGREVKALEAEEKPKPVAFIDEQTCIGCTLCIQACPVDAIVGAAKQMHTIRRPLHRLRTVRAALSGRVHQHR